MNFLRSVLVVLTIVTGFFPMSAVQAAGETEYVLDKTLTSMVPFFMSGHEGDLNWIAGFTFSGTTRLNGVEIGTFSGEVRLLDPPLNLNAPYSHGQTKIINTIPGFGSFEVTASGVSVSSSTSQSAGDIVFAWSGTISNGTGRFADSHGVNAGTAKSNIFAGTGEVKEVLLIRQGF